MSEKNKIIKTQKEPFFSKFFIFPAYVALFFGLIFLPAGGIFMLLSLLVITARSGLQINLKEKKIRDYVRIFGFYTGKWKDLGAYPYITIISRDTLQTVYPIVSLGFNVKDKQCEICLLDSTHRKKILLERVKQMEIAKQRLLFYTENLGVEDVQFNPQGGIRINNGDTSVLFNQKQP